MGASRGDTRGGAARDQTMTRPRIVEDDHARTIEYFLAKLTGSLGTVVHLGAHAGEEVDAYRRHGAERIVLVEANATSCETLQQCFGDDRDIAIVHAAVTDHVGTDRLLLHTNSRGQTESASLFPMKRLGEIVSTMHTEGAIEVPATTLDALLEELSIEPTTVGLLALDIQGAELCALRGGARVLPGLHAVLTEVSFVDLYAGAPQAADVERLLAAAGFELVDAVSYELYEGDRRFPAWGDQLYARH